jgi:hypothetical protein
VLGTLNAFGYALLASGTRREIRNHSAQCAVNRLGGTTLICAGVPTIWKQQARDDTRNLSANPLEPRPYDAIGCAGAYN